MSSTAIQEQVYKAIQLIWPPTLFFSFAIAVWQAIVWAFNLPPILLPGPIGITKEALREWPLVVNATYITAKQSVCGFTLSILVGSIIAITFSQSKMFRRCAFPFAIAFQTIPIISIAPLIILWFDRGFMAIVFVSFLIALFPIITNTTSGLISIPRGQQDLFRLNRANRWQFLWKLQIPSALPDFVNGAKVSAGLSVLGAIVGEYFAGNVEKNRGIGYWIYDSNTIRLDRLFVYVVASTLLGVALFGIIAIIGDKILLHWRDPNINEK